MPDLANSSSVNSTTTGQSYVFDDHIYYDSHIYWKNVPLTYLRDCENELAMGPLNQIGSTIIENVPLSSPIKFYGHLVDNVIITGQGYINLNNIAHPFLYHSQYVAPLMADFILLQKNSVLWYKETEKAFYIRWNKVFSSKYLAAGPFTFDAALYKNGTIFFNYIQIPIKPSDISPLLHPVKVGVSDGYIGQISQNDNVRHVFVRYHAVELNQTAIGSGSAVLLTPRPTCVERTSCNSCLKPIANFNCTWCPELSLCSSGVDRNRDSWFMLNCHLKRGASQCVTFYGMNEEPEDHVMRNVVVFIVLLFSFMILIGLGWFIYAYTNPTSPSGLCLIENHPRILWRRYYRSSDDIDNIRVEFSNPI